MSNEEIMKQLDELNNTMESEEKVLKDHLDELSKLISDLMEAHMPAPENRPAEPTITIVNTVTGEEKVITQSEYAEMVKNAIY